MRCDFSLVLALAEVRFGAEQWDDISGSETGEGYNLWLVFRRKGEGFSGAEEEPSRGRRTKDGVDEDLGCPEPREPVQGRASEEVR